MSEKKRSLKLLVQDLLGRLSVFRKYLLPGFIALTVLIYGFLLLKVNTLVNTQPSDLDVQTQVKATKTPHIDDQTVEQLKSLRDNSETVRSFFENFRENPF